MLLSNSMSIITRSSIQILEIENAFAKAEISLFGGHLLSYVPQKDNRERIWLSKEAILDGKTPIRGGIPLCWPWFGDHPDNSFSAHGYVRNQTWEIIDAEDSELGSKVILKPASSVGSGFHGRAQLTLEILIGHELTLRLSTSNIGEQAFSYSCALHSYFAISDIRNCVLKGLQGQYIDKTRHLAKLDTVSPYTFNEETDRVHLHQPSIVDIVNENTVTSVRSKGHDSMVVWNPWKGKSTSMRDMADNGYQTMVCVETAITQGQDVQPGETHLIEQTII